MDQAMYTRAIKPELLSALTASPVVLLQGPRQTGKSTLAKSLGTLKTPRRYLTLDDFSVQRAALSDPVGFIRGLEGAVTIDEVQRAPDLLQAIKLVVDEDRRAGRFLLTGSTNIMALPKLSESLTGRVRIITLWPLSEVEIEGAKGGFIDALFADTATLKAPRGNKARELWPRVLRGGFPEPVALPARDRPGWFEAYVTTRIERDVRELANIEHLSEVPRLLHLIATRAGALENQSDLGRMLGLSKATLRRYLALLEGTFLAFTLRAWSTNLGLRLTKAPKLYLVDTGLLAALLRIADERVAQERGMKGPLLENFVAMELVKQAASSAARPGLFHYRTPTGREIDFVVEHPDGRVSGIEVKAAQTLGERDFGGMKAFAEAVGKRFHRGIILYGGAESASFGTRMQFVPLPWLWQETTGKT